MKEIILVLQNDDFRTCKFNDYCFEVRDIKVCIMTKEDKMRIFFNNHFSNNEAIERLKYDFLSLVFLLMGGFPKIFSIEEDGEEVDFSKMAGRFFSSSYFLGSLRRIVDINADTINKETLEYMSHFNHAAHSSMQWLVSNNYHKVKDGVIITHRLLLLLFVLDGIVEDKYIENSRSRLEMNFSKHPKMRTQIGCFLAKAHHLFECTFFKADRDLIEKILFFLDTDQLGLLLTLTDTRNWYSHLLPMERKPEKLFGDGTLEWVYFELLLYSIRIYEIKKLPININNINLRYYDAIHDWAGGLFNKSYEPRLLNNIADRYQREHQ